MRRRLTTLRAVILNGFSIEFLVARNTDGDEVSIKVALKCVGVSVRIG